MYNIYCNNHGVGYSKKEEVIAKNEKQLHAWLQQSITVIVALKNETKTKQKQKQSK